MKKLLRSMMLFGLVALPTVNVVACNNENPISVVNDLTKSFQNNYSKDVNGTTITSELLGLSVNGTTNTNFDFNINKVNKDALNLIVIKKPNGATITSPICITDATTAVKPTLAGSILAVATAINQNNIVPKGITKVVSFQITLTLWKSQAKSGSTTEFEYVKTDTKMNVTINLATQPATGKINIDDKIVGIQDLKILKTNNAEGFKAALQDKLISIKGLEDITTQDYNVYQANSDKAVTDDQIQLGTSLTIKIVATGVKYEGTVDNIVTTYIHQKIDISTGIEITNPKKLNVNAASIKDVTKYELKPALDNIIATAVQNKAGLIKVFETTDYTYDLFSDNKGTEFQDLSLTAPSHVFVQITATETKLTGKTDYLEISLPAVNRLSAITSIAAPTKDNFGSVTAASVTKEEIIQALKTNGDLLKSLETINNRVTDISSDDQIFLKISTTIGGRDIVDIDLTSAKDVYIELIPGSIHLFSGTSEPIKVILPSLS